MRLLSLTVETKWAIFSKSFKRVHWFALLKWQRRECCVVISSSIIHEQNASKVSLKLWNYNTYFYYRTYPYITFCCFKTISQFIHIYSCTQVTKIKSQHFYSKLDIQIESFLTLGIKIFNKALCSKLQLPQLWKSGFITHIFIIGHILILHFVALKPYHNLFTFIHAHKWQKSNLNIFIPNWIFMSKLFLSLSIKIFNKVLGKSKQ